MTSTDDSTDYTTWTPEQLMRDYHGELKRELFLRCMEWYTNSEVEAKINAGRTDGSKIQNSNFYGEFKRFMDTLALRDGHLPTEYRLLLDRRRLINLQARFGADHESVKPIAASVRRRDALSFPTLSANPSLEELEAARPDNGKKLQKGRETRDYWYEFLAATQRYSEKQIQTMYNMAPSTAYQEIKRAQRIVARIKELEHIESTGGSVRQTYTPPPLLLPGQEVYKYVAPPFRPSLIVILKIKPRSSKPNGSASMHAPKIPSPSPPGPTSLLSVRMKTTLSRLRHDFDKHPHYPPPLTSLATRFEPPPECVDMTERERQNLASCETEETLAAYALWCETEGAEIVRANSPGRLSKCLSLIICLWRDEVMVAESAGAEELGETFLMVSMRRLADLEGVEEEVRVLGMMEEVWARGV